MPDLVPGDSLSVVGFPYGRMAFEPTLGAFAIWTRASLATDFFVDVDATRCFLIDARTRSGQSGSPVLFHSGERARASEGDARTILQATMTVLLGVYSGRLIDQEDAASSTDLGRVWRCEVIRDILRGERRATVLHP
jgi:hypothetical protein